MAESKTDAERNASGSVTLKTLLRTLSLRRRRGSETDETASNAKPSSPDTQKSPTGEDGFRFTKKRSSKRLSISEKFRSDLEDSATVSMEKEKEIINDCNFTYDILPKSLSVMEINNLIETEALKEAYQNILCLQKEVQCEQEALGKESSPVKLVHKEKDLNLLYISLRNKLNQIICRTCTQPSCNKELLVQMVAIIQDKEKREGDVEGWRDVWRTAIQQGVKETLGKIHPDSNNKNVSCMVVYLELLSKKIVELLEMVKAELLNLYPPNFFVFKTYASSCHEFVGEHLKDLLGNITEMKDYNAMLDFVINRYHSEILSSPSLQPEMKDLKVLTLSGDLLDQIKKAYCDCLQVKLHASLDNVINTEQEKIWKKKVTPKRTKDGTFLISEIYTDVCEMIRKYSENCATIDENLEQMTVCKCMEALKYFPRRFEEGFSKQCHSLLGSDVLDCCLWAEYHVAYINSFSFFKDDMEGYRQKCPGQVEELVTEVDRLIDSLKHPLLEQFRVEIEPYLGDLMTRNWINTDADFSELVNRIETYSGYSKSMRELPAQSFANDVHYHVAKVYIAELLKNKYSCKGRKNEVAAAKINEQWTELKTLFCEMGSKLDWLHSLGYQISKIIEQENEKDIKNVLTPLVENYPDISKKQLSAILYFRDSGFKFERSPAIQCFIELKRKIDKWETENTGNHTFFSDIK